MSHTTFMEVRNPSLGTQKVCRVIFLHSNVFGSLKFLYLLEKTEVTIHMVDNTISKGPLEIAE